MASPDGIHWRDVGRTGLTGDRTTFFYNPFRRVWVFSLRGESDLGGLGRHRRYWETPDLFANVNWQRADEPVFWMGADDRDPRRPEYNVPPELYNLDCVAYESVLLGPVHDLPRRARGPRKTERRLRRLQPRRLSLGPHRTDGRFSTVDEHVGSWNWANVQSAGGCCLIVGDRLYFYVSGRKGVPGTSDPGVCSTGLATLRRDGFASMDHGDRASGVQHADWPAAPGTLTTRPVRFAGQYLFVNVDLDAPAGELRVEVLDRDGRALAPFGQGSCRPIRAGGTRVRVGWEQRETLEDLSGAIVRFRFHLTHGRLYAFWVSAAPDGHSGGYVGAGGPAFRGNVDDGRPVRVR